MILTIKASAGSGKTYTLTRRFLECLDEATSLTAPPGCVMRADQKGLSLPEIMAATFTNKAAAEMKARVIDSLKRRAFADRAEGLRRGRAEQLVDGILRHYSRLNIRTIDSLLMMLVRLSALQLGLPSDFEPSFEAAGYFTPVYEALMDDVSGQGADRPSPAAAPVFHEHDAAVLRADLAEVCRALVRFGSLRGFVPRTEVHDRVHELVLRLLREEEVPRVDPADIWSRLRLAHAGCVGACGELLEALDREELQVHRNFRDFLRGCTATPLYRSLPESVFRYKDHLDDCLLQESRGRASGTASAAFERAYAAVAAYLTALPLCRHALQLAPLAALASEIHARMRRGPMESGLLPFPRLPLLAGKVLSGENGVSDALCRMGSRLSRLFLDEFQDTSREQWRAVLPLAEECLSKGGDLVYVGDVKQAIYGWRGGDARLFDEVPDAPELRSSPERRSLTLEENWRSHPVIVRHNNAFFSLLAKKTLAEAVLGAMLPKETPVRHRQEAADAAARIFADARQEIAEKKALEWHADPRGAKAVARLYEVRARRADDLRELVRGRLRRLFLEELLPEWKPGDIAILVRAGDEAALAAGWLAEWGVPVVTENSFLLLTHPLVEQLLSFLSFLDYPEDDAVFMAVVEADFLRGPAWPEADAVYAFAAAAVCREGAERPPLYRLFREDFPEAWQAVFEPFYARSGLMSAYDILCEMVRRFSLFERLPEQAAFVRRLLELAHLAEKGGHSSPAAFLAFVRECGAEEKLPLPEHMDAVRVMTIHKAKGLEFPVVVLPFQHKTGKGEPEPVVADWQGLRLLTRMVRELGDPYYRKCVTDELERLNLLYVAWTRPVYALHAFLTQPERQSTALSRALPLLAEHYRERYGETLCEWESLGSDDEDQDSAGGLPPEPEAVEESAASPGGGTFPALPPPPLPWRPMSWLPRLSIYRFPLTATHFSPRQRGILAHLCLEHLHLASADGDRADDVDRAVRQGMLLFPLPLSDPERVAEDMRRALSWFAGLPDAAFWLRHGLREQSLMDGDGRLHRADMLVDGGGGPLLALDYKTGEASPRVLGAHSAQVRRYMDLMSAVSGREVRGMIAYLDERRLVPVESGGGGGA